MFEYHGWIVLRDSFDDDDVVAETTQRLMGDAQTQIAKFAADNPFIELRALNGDLHLLVTGAHNRRLAVFDDVLALYQYVAERARASYGVLYARDDEDPQDWKNRFRVWALAQGALSEREDTHLSPCVPVIDET